MARGQPLHEIKLSRNVSLRQSKLNAKNRFSERDRPIEAVIIPEFEALHAAPLKTDIGRPAIMTTDVGCPVSDASPYTGRVEAGIFAAVSSGN